MTRAGANQQNLTRAGAAQQISDSATIQNMKIKLGFYEKKLKRIKKESTEIDSQDWWIHESYPGEMSLFAVQGFQWRQWRSGEFNCCLTWWQKSAGNSQRECTATATTKDSAASQEIEEILGDVLENKKVKWVAKSMGIVSKWHNFWRQDNEFSCCSPIKSHGKWMGNI